MTTGIDRLEGKHVGGKLKAENQGLQGVLAGYRNNTLRPKPRDLDRTPPRIARDGPWRPNRLAEPEQHGSPSIRPIELEPTLRDDVPDLRWLPHKW